MIVDIVILVLIAFGALIGFIRGFTRELVSLVGIFVILALSFILKNPISVILYSNLPFFNFGGIFKDITVLNILVYEALAFFIVFIVLFIIFKILLKLTKIFERILSMTIILGIPSKILGMILGIVQSIIYIFITLYILNLPMIGSDIINDSKLSNIILDKTPILNTVCDKTFNVVSKVIELKEKYENTDNVREFNQEALDIMIENNVITKENVQKLIDKGKIKGLSI